MNADKQIEQPATSHDHRLKILKRRINRLLRKRPPLPLAELAHVLLSKHRVGHALPLIGQKLGVNPRAFLRRRADPLPLLAAFRPLRMKKSAFAVWECSSATGLRSPPPASDASPDTACLPPAMPRRSASGSLWKIPAGSLRCAAAPQSATGSETRSRFRLRRRPEL